MSAQDLQVHLQHSFGHDYRLSKSQERSPSDHPDCGDCFWDKLECCAEDTNGAFLWPLIYMLKAFVTNFAYLHS